MTDHESLYRVILDHPDEDTPRLVYADWLEENGEVDRAEFVRVQVELARVKPCYLTDYDLVFKHHANGTCRSCDLRRRERELLFPNGKARPHREWFPSFGDEWLFKISDYQSERLAAVVRRGFIGLSEGRDEAFFFDRVRCGTCDGHLTGIVSGDPGGNPVCPTCHGSPLNEWTCPKWPTIVFEMPLPIGNTESLLYTHRQSR